MSSASGLLSEWQDSARVQTGSDGLPQWTCNPLHCLHCDKQLVKPVTLSACAHVFCQTCVTVKDKSVRCELCGQHSAVNVQHAHELPVDTVVQFLLDTTNERAATCANCDKLATPMYFCEQCQQALCAQCKTGTHQARMFASHRIVTLQERAMLRAERQCASHDQPLLLFATDCKQLMCIKCFRSASADTRQNYVDLDVAHKMGSDKLDRVATKLKRFQSELKEQCAGHGRFLEELSATSKTQKAHIQQTCQQMIDTLMQVRDKLLLGVESERAERERVVSEQLRAMFSVLPNVQLCLMAASVFVSSASVIDFLKLAYELVRRMQHLITEHKQLAKLECTGQVDVNCRDEFAHALEPYLGVSSFVVPGTLMDTNGQHNNSNSAGGKFHSRRTVRSGSGYVNCPGANGNWCKYQLMVDLDGAFGAEFSKVDSPVDQLSAELQQLSLRAQDMQRDLTVRRVIIEQPQVDSLTSECNSLEQRTQTHLCVMQEVYPQLQQLWQEQLDRVRRQQQLYRQRLETCVQLRHDVQHIGHAAQQLMPFVHSLATTACTIDPRRQHSAVTEPVAPMDRIRHDIESLAPDSAKRVDAIEKEEQQRRERAEKEKALGQQQLVSAKKHLKSTGGGQTGCKQEHQHRKTNKQRLHAHSNRERSRGGTDHALMLSSPKKYTTGTGTAKGTNVDTSNDTEVETVNCEPHADTVDSAASHCSSDLEMTSADEQIQSTSALVRALTLRADNTHLEGNNTDMSHEDTSCLSMSLPTQSTQTHAHTLDTNRPLSLMQGPADNAAVLKTVPTIVPAKVGTAPTNWWNGYRPGVSVMPETLQAREQLMLMLKERVPRIDVGALGSPDRLGSEPPVACDPLSADNHIDEQGEQTMQPVATGVVPPAPPPPPCTPCTGNGHNATLTDTAT